MKSKGTDTRGSVTHTLIIKSFNVNHNLCNILQYSFKFHQRDLSTVARVFALYFYKVRCHLELYESYEKINVASWKTLERCSDRATNETSLDVRKY